MTADAWSALREIFGGGKSFMIILPTHKQMGYPMKDNEGSPTPKLPTNTQAPEIVV